MSAQKFSGYAEYDREGFACIDIHSSSCAQKDAAAGVVKKIWRRQECKLFVSLLREKIIFYFPLTYASCRFHFTAALLIFGVYRNM